MPCSTARRLVCVLALVALVHSPAASGPTDSDSAPGRPFRGVPLSSAYERMLRDQIARGRVLPPEVIRRFGLDLPESEPAFETAAGDELRRTETLRGPRPAGPGVALLPDAQVNNKALDATCSACGFRPLGQAETSIAALGSLVLAGWNNTKGFCTGGAVQGYGTSTNGGATWTDAGDPPVLPTGGRYRGDPVSAVNASAGSFYILGLYEGGTPGSGLALARGHFSGGAFVIDDNREIAVGGADFLDKDWMAVDPATGNLYVTYARFIGGNDGQVEVMRSTTNGASWDAPIVMNQPAALNLVQGVRPVVGPDGEVYVVWYEYGVPQSHMRIRRSDDLGASFGPEHTVCDFYENYFSGAPGFRRGFGVAFPSIAIDRTNGPYRGRVYVAWDESVNFNDAPFSASSSRSEVENNDFFAAATPFAVGDVLRGTLATAAEIDLWKFTGARGQTIYFNTDSATAGTAMNMRLVCASDTSSVANYRFLAFDQDTRPSLVFTLPSDGSYHLRLGSSTSTPPAYRIRTAFDTPSAGERARDHRDQFLAYSDDGSSWSTPVRLSDSGSWFDGEFPEVTVDGTGAVHVFWHDFRDDPACGAESHEYLVSSGNGGASFGPNRRLSDASSFWSFNACGSANHGDYQGITSDGNTVYPCWSDSRLGDPDVWSEGDVFQHASGCPPAFTALAGSSQTLSFTIRNLGSSDGSYTYQLGDRNGWMEPRAGGASVGPGGSVKITASIGIPSDCAPGVDTVRLVSGDLDIPGRSDTCITVIHCVATTDVSRGTPAVLHFSPPGPNPSPRGARFHFGLSHEGPARLEILAANGARVRTLASGRQMAGEHDLQWDGRNEQGHRMPAGVYYARLDAEGRSLERAVVILP